MDAKTPVAPCLWFSSGARTPKATLRLSGDSNGQGQAWRL